MHGDATARARLIEGHLPLVEMLARRYAYRGERMEDLLQVGSIGLILAIDRFDLDRQVALTTFAVPTIEGEIKKHLRDRSSPIRVPRRLHELGVRVRRPRLELENRLERTPTAAELANATGMREEEIREVLATEYARAPLPLAAERRPESGEAENLGDGYEAIDDRLSLAGCLRLLDRRERRIVQLRFSWALSQDEIAATLGMSQAHVSRLLRSALDKLRAQLENERLGVTAEDPAQQSQNGMPARR